jgi:hypothetical protein
MKRFVERHLVTPEELPKYYAAIDAGVHFHDSIVPEMALLAFVYSGGMWTWRHQIAVDIASWYASSQGGQIHLTMAGYWLAFVSVPVFQFILLRWYMQILIWFLFRVSRLKLTCRIYILIGQGDLALWVDPAWPVLRCCSPIAYYSPGRSQAASSTTEDRCLLPS